MSPATFLETITEISFLILTFSSKIHSVSTNESMSFIELITLTPFPS